MDIRSLSLRPNTYYRALTPMFKKPEVAAYTMLTLSFFAMGIFGMFAIRPTLATIAQLRKKITDHELVHTRIGDKVAMLRSAGQEYEAIAPDLDEILATLPKKPQLALLLGKLNKLFSENNIEVVILQFSPVALVESETNPNVSTIEFTLTGKANYGAILTFVARLSQIDRIVTISSIDISTDGQAIDKEPLTIIIRGKAYVFTT